MWMSRKAREEQLGELQAIRTVLHGLLEHQKRIADPKDGTIVPSFLCFVCVKNAVTRGLEWSPGNTLRLSDGTRIHEAVSANAGTPVCFYHVDHDVEQALRPSGS